MQILTDRSTSAPKHTARADGTPCRAPSLRLDTRARRAWVGTVAGTLTCALAATAAGPARLAAQGVGYTLTPQVSQVRWAKALGLDNGYLYGGNLSFDFERYLSLQGYYFTNSGVQSTLGDLKLTDNVGAALTDRDVGLRSYGAKLRVNLGAGRIAPFLTGCGGVFQVRPDGGRRSEQLVQRRIDSTAAERVRIALDERARRDSIAACAPKP